MTYYIPFAFEMIGRVPIEAESLQEAKEEARAWLTDCNFSELMSFADYLEDSVELDEEGCAKDEQGNLIPM